MGDWFIRCLVPYVPPRKLTWLAGKSTMNEGVFPIENWDCPSSHGSFQGCNLYDL